MTEPMRQAQKIHRIHAGKVWMYGFDMSKMAVVD